MPPVEGARPIHRFYVYRDGDGPAVGTLTREYEQLRPLHELADELPPEKVRRVHYRG